MGSNIYWRPVAQGAYVSKDIWNALGALFDGSTPKLLTRNDLHILHAFMIGNIEGAADLMAAIEKHGEIELREVY